MFHYSHSENKVVHETSGYDAMTWQQQALEKTGVTEDGFLKIVAGKMVLSDEEEKSGCILIEKKVHRPVTMSLWKTICPPRFD